MAIEQVETPKTKEEEQQENKPILNIQLPFSEDGTPGTSLSIGKHNASAQHNFQEVANVLLTIINNQKMMGMILHSMQEKQLETDKALTAMVKSFDEILEKKEDAN